MCRNIRPLFNFEPPATDDEIRASALQYVRKVSGFTKPSQANESEFERAVDEVAAVTRRLLDSLVTKAPAKDRDVETAKARKRAAARYGSAATGLALALLVGLPAAPATAQQRSASELEDLRRGTPNGTWRSAYDTPVHPVTLIRDATIMTAAVDFPAGTPTIDATGKIVTPGFIDAGMQLGLIEVGSVSDTPDASLDDGANRAAFRVSDGLNPRSMLFAIVRGEGITNAISAPSGGVISGQAMALSLAGSTRAEVLARDGVALYANLGTLEQGKLANLVIWSADPFDFSGYAERVLIEGREVDLDSRQRRLFERYRTIP